MDASSDSSPLPPGFGRYRVGRSRRRWQWRIELAVEFMLPTAASLAHFAPGADETSRFGHVVMNHPVELRKVAARHTGKHMVFSVPVHVPVEKLRNGIEPDGSDTLSEIWPILSKAGMHRHAHQVAKPIFDKAMARDQHNENRMIDQQEDGRSTEMEGKHNSGPAPAGDHASRCVASIPTTVVAQWDIGTISPDNSHAPR